MVITRIDEFFLYLIVRRTLVGSLFCCDGYKRNVTNNICTPVCTYKCPENAYCFLPEVCACKLGYEAVNNQCKPICLDGCINGECMAPGVCQCKPGTRLDYDNKCVGACEEGCVYSTCKAHVCTCHDYKSNYTSDIPTLTITSSPAYFIAQAACSGECPALNICKCRSGVARNRFGKCVSLTDPPQCQYGCGPNGRCIADELCECDLGFTNDPLTNRCILDDGTDAPVSVCQHPCLNGYCTRPNQCICNQGYTQDIDDPTTCVPVCEGGCANGVCILPNVCICNFGYREENGRKVCVP
ncbi:uncharacterized protein [Anoplolepis gracilipes]|uniref:uncharacterized protein n=1 Tax=Anoplolepis gracilipes TaxID=354296 RepID=UPI003BA2322B